MKKILFILGYIIFCMNCASIAAQDIGSVNYKELPRIDIDVSIEIKESDEYLPGRLLDVVPVPGGSMLVSDFQKKTIEQFDSRGNYMGIIAREGEGPGELPPFFSLIETGNDTLLVWSNGARQLDYLAPGTDERYRYVKSTLQDRFREQRLEIIGYSDKKYFAITGLPDAAFIKPDLPDYRKSPVAVLDKSLNMVKDSLYMLKIPNNLFGDPGKFSSRIRMNGLAYLGTPPYRYQDRLRFMNDGGYLIARPDSSALFLYNNNHKLKKRIHLNVNQRPLKQSDLDYALNKQQIEDRRILSVLKDHVQEFKPPFLNIWVSENHVWLYTDENVKGKEFVVLTIEGDFIGKFYLSTLDEIKSFKNEHIYTIYKNPEAGDRIRIYKIDL